MSDLFLPTLEMMGLTFAIGFFVAFIIKLIASAADSLDFYSSHQQELLRLRRIKKFRQKMELMLHTPLHARKHLRQRHARRLQPGCGP